MIRLGFARTPTSSMIFGTARHHRPKGCCSNHPASSNSRKKTTLVSVQQRLHQSKPLPATSLEYKSNDDSEETAAPPVPSTQGVIVVLDFDKTIIDVDSDNWVVDELGFTDLFNRLLPTMPWNSMMDKMMGEMHKEGVTVEEIAKVLQRIPIHPRVIPAIKSAYAAGCELRIVSDANEFFIETVLEHLGVRSCFSEINTNPGRVDDQGRLRIGAHHDSTRAPHGHGCPNPCPPNMCKGQVMERMLAEHNNNSSRIIYLGDGLGDYCPSLKLRSRDFVMPRKDFPAYELLIASDPSLVKAEVHHWTDGAQLESVLLGLIHKLVPNPATNPATTEALFNPHPAMSFNSLLAS